MSGDDPDRLDAIHAADDRPARAWSRDRRGLGRPIRRDRGIRLPWCADCQCAGRSVADRERFRRVIDGIVEVLIEDIAE